MALMPVLNMLQSSLLALARGFREFLRDGDVSGLPRLSCMFQHPIGVVDIDLALLVLWLAAWHRHRRHVGVVDGAGSVPRHVLVLVVRLAGHEVVVWVRELPLDNALRASLGHVVVVVDPLATDYNARAKFSEHGPGRNDAYRATLVRVRDDVALNHV